MRRMVLTLVLIVGIAVGGLTSAHAANGWHDPPKGDCSRIASTLLYDTHPGTRLARDTRRYLNTVPDATWSACWRKAERWWYSQDWSKYRNDRPGRNTRSTGWMN